MGRKSRPGKIPRWYKGKLIRETYSGFWYGEREGKLFEQEGKMVDKQNFDSVTDKQRQEAIQRRLR